MKYFTNRTSMYFYESGCVFKAVSKFRNYTQVLVALKTSSSTKLQINLLKYLNINTKNLNSKSRNQTKLSFLET